MPELPEVETVVRQLDQVLPGRVIGDIEVLREKSAQSDLNGIVGKKIAQVTRKQKMIVVELDENHESRVVNQEEADNDLKREKQLLVVHLKMTGQLIFQESVVGSQEPAERLVGGHPSVDWVGELPSSHTRIIVSFTDGSVLYFNDQRVFGWMKVMDSEEFNVLKSKLPPDVVDPEFSIDYLAQVLKRSARAVKLVILDQQKMGGMGNIYANDALWLAGIQPTRVANKVKKKEVTQLHEAMVETLHKAVHLGGSSYSDFVDTDGLGGKYQDEFLVYDQEGESCQREDCDGVIEKIKVGARGTYYCSVCQK